MRLLRFLTLEINFILFVDPSKIGELHLQATCYVYLLRLRSVLLKLSSEPNVDSTVKSRVETPV